MFIIYILQVQVHIDNLTINKMCRYFDGQDLYNLDNSLQL